MNAAATHRLMTELRRIREGQNAIVDRLDRLIELQEKQLPKKRARKTRKTATIAAHDNASSAHGTASLSAKDTTPARNASDA